MTVIMSSERTIKYMIIELGILIGLAVLLVLPFLLAIEHFVSVLIAATFLALFCSFLGYFALYYGMFASLVFSIIIALVLMPFGSAILSWGEAENLTLADASAMWWAPWLVLVALFASGAGLAQRAKKNRRDGLGK